MYNANSLRCLFVFSFLFLLPNLAEAGITYSNVVPANMSSNVGQPVSVAATVTRTASDPSFSSGYVTVELANNPQLYSVNQNVTFNPGNLTATFNGTVTFTPALPSGTAVKVTFVTKLSDGTSATQDSNFTVK